MVELESVKSLLHIPTAPIVLESTLATVCFVCSVCVDLLLLLQLIIRIDNTHIIEILLFIIIDFWFKKNDPNLL
jgi:hypothetical protein